MISVRISCAELRCFHPQLAEAHILDKLRECKIPVVGQLCFAGVSRGRLTRRLDEVTGDLIYTWMDADE